MYFFTKESGWLGLNSVIPPSASTLCLCCFKQFSMMFFIVSLFARENCFKENKIIKTDIIISAMKKHILRNIKDNDIIDYLFNFNDLRQKDLWDITVFGEKDFEKEFNKLVELDKNVNNVVKYLYSKIYNIEIGAAEEEQEEEEEENIYL